MDTLIDCEIPLNKGAMLGDRPPSYYSAVLSRYYGKNNKKLVVIPNTNSR